MMPTDASNPNGETYVILPAALLAAHASPVRSGWPTSPAAVVGAADVTGPDEAEVMGAADVAAPDDAELVGPAAVVADDPEVGGASDVAAPDDAELAGPATVVAADDDESSSEPHDAASSTAVAPSAAATGHVRRLRVNPSMVPLAFASVLSVVQGLF